MPSAAATEPLPLVLDIIELRRYARAKRALAEAATEAEAPTGPMVDRVFEVESELLLRRNAAWAMQAADG